MKLSNVVYFLGTLWFGACIPDAPDNSKKDAATGTGGVIVSTGGVIASTGGVIVSTGGVIVSTGGAAPSTGGSTTTPTDAGGGPTATTCQAGCAALPMVVDGKDNFVPSGYMGDWNGIKEVSTGTDAAACPSRAHAAAVGNCHHWTWTYSNGVCNTPADPQAVCGKWACVAWLKPNNLFTEPTKPGPSGGLPIAAGATKVQFYAWAPKATSIRFSVGSGTDGVSGSVTGSLTTTPTKFEIDISMSSYNIVNNGFQWCANDTGATSAEFYVDDIKWL